MKESKLRVEIESAVINNRNYYGKMYNKTIIEESNIHERDTRPEEMIAPCDVHCVFTITNGDTIDIKVDKDHFNNVSGDIGNGVKYASCSFLYNNKAFELTAYFDNDTFASAELSEWIDADCFFDDQRCDKTYTYNNVVKSEKVKAAEQILIDNGIEKDEVEIVLQALGYALLDEELYP